MSKTLQKILYVEDEADLQAVVKIVLESVGSFELKICSSGKEAIQEAAAFAPDLLLLDVMMPVMDGPTTLKMLKMQPELEDTPAMFMTAKVQPQEVDALMKLGAIAVIPKPFDPMTLADQIRGAWQASI